VSHSHTDLRIAEFVVWSALTVYAAVWFVGLGIGLSGEWLVAGWATASYVGMHVFEMTRRNHCYLSADSTAVPVSLVLFSSAVLGLWAAGHPPLPGKSLVLTWCIYSAVFMGGHFAALAYSVALDSVLTLMFRRRIAREKGGQFEPADPADRGT
jgi:hypothetical protein